jgi:LysR family transcriptional regulator, glycine cleavage system transcriptional activator
MSMALNAAAAGLGAVLLPDFMVADATASKKLMRLSARGWRAARAYHLVFPAALADHAPLRAFRDWLLQQVHSGSPS